MPYFSVVGYHPQILLYLSTCGPKFLLRRLQYGGSSGSTTTSSCGIVLDVPFGGTRQRLEGFFAARVDGEGSHDEQL